MERWLDDHAAEDNWYLHVNFNVYGDHQTADDKTCRFPLIVRGPDVEPGTDEDFHYYLDFTRTLCELTGAEPGDGWDGQSFADAVTEGASDRRESLVLIGSVVTFYRSDRMPSWGRSGNGLQPTL